MTIATVAKRKGFVIKVRVQFEGPYWSAIFERHDKKGQAIVRQIFATEPDDQALYDFVSHYFYELKFKQSVDTFTLDIDRSHGNVPVSPVKRKHSEKKKRPKRRVMKTVKKKTGRKKPKQKPTTQKLLSKKRTKTKR